MYVYIHQRRHLMLETCDLGTQDSDPCKGKCHERCKWFHAPRIREGNDKNKFLLFI